MRRKSVPVPGNIFEEDLMFGMSFDELLVLGTVPLVLVLPSLFLDFIPFEVSLFIILLGFLGVGVVVIKTPEGQTPTEWFPRYVQTYFDPDTYVAKPRDQTKYGKYERRYLSVVQTADQIEAETENGHPDLASLIEEIEYAERLEPPEWADEETVELRETLLVGTNSNQE